MVEHCIPNIQHVTQDQPSLYINYFIVIPETVYPYDPLLPGMSLSIMNISTIRLTEYSYRRNLNMIALFSFNIVLRHSICLRPSHFKRHLSRIFTRWWKTSGGPSMLRLGFRKILLQMIIMDESRELTNSWWRYSRRVTMSLALSEKSNEDSTEYTSNKKFIMLNRLRHVMICIWLYHLWFLIISGNLDVFIWLPVGQLCSWLTRALAVLDVGRCPLVMMTRDNPTLSPDIFGSIFTRLRKTLAW
jgi:hypothetical protein